MSTKPLILVTNDDGITAPGIRTLISVMNEIGDVVVVAGKGHETYQDVGGSRLIFSDASQVRLALQAREKK